MNAHTPGPWTPDRDPRIGMEWNTHILDQRGHAICFMAHSAGAAPERDEANAALIAAAPELLAALETVVADWTAQFELNGHLAPAWCKQARAAIAKATAGAGGADAQEVRG